MAERKRVTIPITGIDTSTPDHSVEDGKCETLHNLRYTGGAWRNVKGFEDKSLPSLENYDIIYKHPATPEDEYILVDKDEQLGEGKTLYAYLSNNSLFYTTLPLSDNAVVNTPLYDKDLSQVGYIIETEDIDGECAIVVYSAPTLDTFRIYGYEVTPYFGFPTPKYNRLYFPEGQPIVGSIAMEYDANGYSEFSYFGRVLEVSDDRITISGIYNEQIGAYQAYSYKFDYQTNIKFTDNFRKMYRTYDYDKEFYFVTQDILSATDTSMYIKEGNIYLLGYVIDAVKDGGTIHLKYYVMERFFDGVKELSITEYDASRMKEIDWIQSFDLTRHSAADIIDSSHYRNMYSASLNGGVDIRQTICKFYPSSSLSHFGNMLIVKDSEDKRNDYYLLDSGKYRPYAEGLNLSFSMESTNKISPKNILWGKSEKYGRVLQTWETISNSLDESVSLPTTQDNHFRGEFAIFAALRNSNGSILYRTPIQIYNPTYLDGSISISSGVSALAIPDLEGKVGVLKTVVLEDELFDIVDENFALASIPAASKYRKVVVSFDGATTHEDVYDVAFYTTRLYPLTIGYSINDIDVMQESFYLLHSITRASIISDNITSFTIDANMLNVVEQRPVYEATQSTTLYSNDMWEYNNRLHLIGTSVTPDAIQPNTLAVSAKYAESTDAYRTVAITQGTYDGQLWQQSYAATKFAIADNFSLCYDSLQPFIWTFSGKVDKVYFANSDGEYSSLYTLKYAPMLDISYITNRASSPTIKYADIKLPNEKIGTLDFAPTNRIFSPNRIQVSELNDPYTYAYDNSYRIGSASNKIIAINSGAIEMSDAKFGEFPVYVFTKEGIFALQSGAETLYSAIVPINYDVAINPNTLAVNGMVLYFTDKGLHALTNQGAQLLSAPLHTSENRIPEWMRTTQMVYLPEWNEVLCADLPNRKAYVFSLDSKVWSTRNIPEGYILNNDELVGSNFIYNLRNEKEQGKDGISVGISTRPIKLGSMELKRAETIIVRFECATEQTLHIEVEGSVDTQHWQTLRELEDVKTNKDIIIRRTPASVKYLRFNIQGDVTDDIRILAFEVEYYHRWMRKMR